MPPMAFSTRRTHEAHVIRAMPMWISEATTLSGALRFSAAAVAILGSVVPCCHDRWACPWWEGQGG